MLSRDQDEKNNTRFQTSILASPEESNNGDSIISFRESFNILSRTFHDIKRPKVGSSLHDKQHRYMTNVVM